MSRRLILCAMSAFLGLMALPLSSSAQVAPQDPASPLPESVRAVREADPQAYQFRRSLRAVRERASRQRRELSELGLARRASAASVAGNYSIPVFVFRFANSGADPFPPLELEEALFSTNPDSLTLRAYYLEQSQGQLTVGGQVFGWSQLAQNDSYYEGNSNGLSPGDARTGELITETLVAQDASVDFGLYDNDGPDGVPNSGDDDGYVDFVAFVHPESGGECGGSGPNLWSHRWRYSAWPASSGLPYATNDASANGGSILVDDYVLQPGLRCGGGGRIQIGVFCHEFGHAFGLPDLYDINGGGAQGIGHWGLMASGNWNVPERPAHMSAWTKQELGWVETVPVNWARTTLSLPPVEVDAKVYEVQVDQQRWQRSSACPLSGSASLAVGVDAAESSARGWAASAGYGNGWTETVAHDFHSDGGSAVWLDYDYRVDSEAGFDFAFVIVEIAGSETTLAVYDGAASGHGSHELSSILGASPVDYRVKFRFRSDGAYSNEDGNYVSSCRPFVIDQISVSGGGANHSADFEVHRGGWFSPDNAVDNPSSESWLLENRQRQGFDLMLHGQGLMVYHLDREVLSTSLGNSGGNSDATTRGLVVEEADGNFDLLSSATSNRGDGGDPWPGSGGAALFDSTTVPSAIDNGGRPTNFAISQLSAAGDSLRFVVEGGAWPPSLAAVSPDSVSLDSTLFQLALVGASRVQPGATLRLVPASGPSLLSTAGHWLDFDRMSFDFDATGALPGLCDVVLENPDGQTVLLSAALSLGSSTPTGIDDRPVGPKTLDLAQNYPNPFNPRTTILFSVPKSGPVVLSVFDLRGRRVRVLVDGQADAGEHRVVFDGLDDKGRALASGLYFYRLVTDSGSRQAKMLLVR